jgi:nicotinamidase/pyrazinamidase
VDIRLQGGDALVLVDMQEDFVSGSLAVPGAAQIVPVLDRYVALFASRGLPVVATRDWHPGGHMSFDDRGGPWPPHCIAGTDGAQLARGLSVRPDTLVISKGMHVDRDAYSGFDGTELDVRLRKGHVARLFVGGLATDYCVLHTVRDALRHGYRVFLLLDAIRAVDREPGDGDAAIAAMLGLGAQPARIEELAPAQAPHG